MSTALNHTPEQLDELLELSRTITAKESHRDHLGRTIARHCVNGDTTSSAFHAEVDQYRTTSAELTAATYAYRELLEHPTRTWS